jgi:type IV pilus assembly protein PilZ
LTVVDRFKQLIDKSSDHSARSTPRVAKTISLEFKDRLSVIQAIAMNIGEGGLFIKTDKPLEEGEHFLLKMKLPYVSYTLNIKSEVVWTRKVAKGNDKQAGMGVKFIQMSKEDNAVLKQYINANLIDK